jgi:uncharacterized repeat protein (TIGR02543 family)
LVTVTVEVFRPNDESIKASQDFTVLIPKGVTSAPSFNIYYENVLPEEVDGYKTSYKLGEASFALETPVSADGKVFLGWYTDEEYTDQVEKVYVGSYGDLTFYAKWDVSATYKVQYFGEPLEGETYVLLDEDTLDSFIGHTVQAEEKEFAGFTYDSNHPLAKTEGVVEAGGTLVLKLYYTRNEYQVTFDTQGGSEIEPVIAKYQEVIQAPADPTKVGYEFDAWDVEFPLEVTENITVTASWKPALVDYTIKYYGESLVGGFEELDAETEKALTGTLITLTNEKTFEGFTYLEDYEGEVAILEIAADGSSIFKFYYSRNSYKVIFDLNGGSWENPTEFTYKFGAEVSAPEETPLKENYNFSGWNKEFPFSMPAEDVTIVAQWTESPTFIVTFDPQGGSAVSSQQVIVGNKATRPINPTKQGYAFDDWYTEDDEVFDFDTPITESITLYAKWNPVKVPYKVEHYLQNVENDEFTLHQEEPFEDFTDMVVKAYPKVFEGFTPTVNYEEGTVLPDGSLVIKLYYIRNTYSIKVLGNGADEEDVSITQKFGAILTPPTFTREGYEFAGWDKEFPATMPITEEGFEIKALWVAIEYTIFYNITNEFSIEVAANPNPTTYTIEDVVDLLGLTLLDEHGIFFGWFLDEAMAQPFAQISEGTTGNITLYGLVRYSNERSAELEAAYLAELYDDFLSVEQLITLGHYDTSIQWQSNNTTYSVNKAGLVTITDPVEDQEITLTAIITIDNYAYYKHFYFSVSKDYLLDVVFMVDDVEVLTQKILNMSFAVRLEENPTKDGFAFLHWSTEPEGEPYDFETPVTSDLVLYAVWEEETDGTLTVEEFLALPEGAEATVRGYVYLYNDGSYIVSEDGVAVLAYKYKTSDHGDFVVITGTKGYYNGTPQFSATATLVETISTGNEIPLTAIPMTIEEIVTSEFPDANLFGKYLEVTGKVVKLGNYYYLQAEKGDQLSLYQSNTEVLSGLLNQKVTLKVFFYGNQSAVGTGEWRAVFAGYEGEYSIVELTPGEKIDEAINDINITDGQTVTGNLVLPTEGLHGVVITWESSNPDIISETGEVTRPAVGEDDATVTLTATFSVEGVEEEVEYTVTVLAEQESGGNFAEDLFISEYIEGSSNNKAIEIFNGTGQVVDLSQYTLKLYSNGGINPGSTLNLNGTLAHGEVIVIYNSQSSSLLINAIPSSVTKASHGVAGFNGDDAIELLKGSTVIDVFGVVGERENWGEDVTLVRKPEITKGNTTYNAGEWIEYSQDTFNYLGSHEFNSSSVEEKTPEEKIAEAKAEIPLTDNQEVTDDLVLPTVSAHGVTITWESSDSAIISETGEVTRPAVGEDDATVTLTATFSVDEVEEEVAYIVIVKAEQESSGEPVTVTASYTGGTTNMGGGNNAETIKLDPNIFTVTAIKNAPGQNVGLNGAGQIRIYAERNSGNGNTLQISIADGYKITGVEFEFGASTDSPTGNLMLGDSTFDLTTNDLKNTTKTYSELDITTFSLQNTQTGGSNNAQIYILSIQITYVPIN